MINRACLNLVNAYGLYSDAINSRLIEMLIGLSRLKAVNVT